MRWDDFIDDNNDGQVATKAPEAILTDGTHVGKIGWVQIHDKDWAKRDDNLTGTCLTVRVDVSGFKSVFQSIPCHWRGAVEELCASARVAPPQKGEDWDETQLIDCTVSVEVLRAISKAGNEYVKVVRFKPTAQGSTPKPARKTQAQKIDVETSAPSDDIPF